MQTERLTITVEEAAKELGISRALAYEMARIGKLPTLRFGRRLVVPRRAVDRLLENPRPSSANQS
jgi:excisionase family DNA binding protein